MFCERMIFDFAELKPVLSFGVRLQFDLIVKPRRFLEKLLYHHAVERTRGDISVILVGFEDDRPFLAALLETLSTYPDSSVTKEAFNALCRQIERQVYRGNSAAPLLQDFDTYQKYRCALLGVDAAEASHANQMILAMLYERNLTELAESLLPEFTQQEFWMMHEIEKLVHRHWNRTDWTAQPANTDGLELSPEINFGDFLDQAANEMESQLVRTTVRELRASEAVAVSLKDNDHTNAVERQDEGAPVNEMNAPQRAVEQTEVSRKTFIRFDEEEPVIYRSKLEQQPPGPFPSLTQLIDEKNRKLFVRKIFDRDVDGYTEFIQRLELVQTWKEAKQLLDQELNRRKISPYSKEVIRLSDLIFGRYFSKRT
jgi:hypothetical protein